MNDFESTTLKKYQSILRAKNYSQRTIDSYSCAIKVVNKEMFKDIYHCSRKDIQDYFITKQFASISQQNIYISAVKLFFDHILGRKMGWLDIERPRREKHLPRVIDKDLLVSKINAIENLKHKAIISLGFSVGLRVSEVVNLKIKDIDSSRMIINILNAKGRKDRIVPLSENLLQLLREYYQLYKPVEYLFEGQFGGPYSRESCEKLIKKYIDPAAGFHILRHSSFTSMLESGTDLRIIQTIAGHERPSTTAIYTHVSVNCLKGAALPI